MRTVYLGTSEFAVTVLERLAASEHAPALVVTRPDRRSGRGRRVTAPPVADAARALGIELAQPAEVNAPEVVDRIAAVGAEALCVCAFGAIIGDPLLAVAEGYNVHPSLLPRWRGAAPIERAIEAGDADTGVCVMRPVTELDAGPVYLTAAEPINPDDDYGTLAPRLAALGGELLVRALDVRPDPVAQAGGPVTYAAKVEPGERRLDPALGAAVLARRVRALSPHIGTWVALGGDERLGVLGAAAVPGGAPPQGVVEGRAERLLLGTADGALELTRVRPPGGRLMSGADYLRGRIRSSCDNRNGG